MITLSLVFLVAALVLFIVAALGVPTPPRFNLIAAGLACFIAAQLSGLIR
jgi:hypothetical protein